MRRRLALLLLFSLAALGQTASSPAGTWISTLRNFDEPIYFRLQLDLDGAKLTGKLGGDIFEGAFEGTFQNGQIEGAVKPNPRLTIQFRGTLSADGRIAGTGRLVEQKRDLKWEASRQQTQNSPPKRHSLEPTQF